jgi:hypothetical protein
MSADAIRLPWQRSSEGQKTIKLPDPAAPPELPRAPLTPTELETRIQAIEAAMRLRLEEVEALTHKAAEDNRRIRELEIHVNRVQSDLRDANTQIVRLTEQNGNLRGRLEISEHSRELQGARMGKLEKLIEEIPTLRHQLISATMSARIFQLWGAEQTKRLQEAGLPFDPEPHIPTIPPPHPDDPGGIYGS